MKLWPILIVLVASLAVVLYLHLNRVQEGAQMADLVVAGGTLIDGITGPLEADIAIKAGKIMEIGPELARRYPNAQVIDATGKFIVPGLIDTHVHLGGSAGAAASAQEFTPKQFELNLRAYLYNGVTAVLDLGGMKDPILKWRQMEKAGELLAPRIFAVGPAFTAPQGHPVSTIFKGLPPEIVEQMASQVADPERAREEVRKLAGAGVDAIKVIYDNAKGSPPTLSYELLKAIIAEAHRQGLKAFVHVGTVRDASEAIAAGADGLEHMIDEPDPEGLKELFKLASEKGVFYTSTLAVYEAFSLIAAGPGFLKHYHTAGSVSQTVLESLQREEFLARYQEKREELQRRLEAALKNTREAHFAGVRLALGTDAGNATTFHGLAVHRELALLVKAGLSPREALSAATKTAAEKLNAPELGAIEVGKAADLLIIEADPLKDITNLRRIEWVIKRGIAYRREELAVPVEPVEVILPKEDRVEEKKEEREKPVVKEADMDFEETKEAFVRGRALLYNSSTKEEFLRAEGLLKEARMALKKLAASDYQVLHLLASVECELGNLYSLEIGELGHQPDRRRAAESFEAARAAAEQALALKDTSEAHHLLGEALQRLIEFRGWPFAVLAGPRAKMELERALNLDPRNADAHISLGLWFFFAPELFGGNLNKAIQSLERGLKVAATEHQRFLAHIWLGEAYLKKNQRAAAKEHLQKALEIYPHSGWAKYLLKKAGE